MEIHEHPLSWEALGAFVVIIITLVLTASLHPLVHSLHRKTKIPVLLCTFIILLILLIPFAIIGLMIIPNLVNGQLPQLFTSIDVTLKHLPLIGQYFTNFSIVHYL
ncbi:MAG: hypothetical protein WCP15_04070 [bacterium]